ncbi:hypothetical protein ACH4JS_22840 [Streptomyces sp. NPDC017638]|uniref:hypothetical protein n=1 Tax=Streptomyces sp. NPDC017638 TaxID=3365004 RepID=UPI0037AD7B23
MAATPCAWMPRISAVAARPVSSGRWSAPNDSETERLTVDVRMSERVLREVYLAPSEAAVEAGVWLVMAAYNKVNGTTMTTSPLLDGRTCSGWRSLGAYGPDQPVAAPCRCARTISA